MMYLHTVSAIADDIVDQLDPRSVEALKSMKKDELPGLHHGWGTAIRNHYGLWSPDNPITKNWHAYPEKHDMRDGVDYSKDHPDSVSMQVMEAVWTKVNA